MRMFTPIGWGIVAVVVLIGLVLIGGAVGLRWDPFDLERRRLEAAKAEVGIARREAEARALEVAGERAQAGRVEIFHHNNRAVERATEAATEQAGRAADASLPLDTARLARLSAHDRELCRVAGHLDGCSTAADGAGRGDPALRSGNPAG